MALSNLGGIYLDRKSLPLKALNYFEKGHKSGVQRPNWNPPSAQWILISKQAITKLEKDSKEKKKLSNFF